VNNLDTGPSGLVSGHLADQMVALDDRILSANTPGSLDGLFANHVMRGLTAAPFTWNVNPITARWLEQNTDRLGHAPQLAALGYGLTHFSSDASGDARKHLAAGLSRLMLRDPYPADGVTFLHDPRQLVGVTLGSTILREELPQVCEWLLRVVQDERLRTDTARQDLVRHHVRSVLADEVATLGGLSQTHDVANLALAHWMTSVGTARLADPAADLPLVQRAILSGLMQTRANDLSVPDAALLRTAAGQIIAASIDAAVLNRSHVGVVLRRFEPAMRRWRWDDPTKVKDPIQWPITSEREVQDILWALLRTAFDDVVDEEPLRKVGHSSYRPDFGLPRLGVLVEVKYVRSAADFKKIEKEVMEDSVAYLREASTYKKIVVFIYDESASVQDHDITAAALRELEHVIDVIIVCRPSQLPAPVQAPTNQAAGRRRRGVVSSAGS